MTTAALAYRHVSPAVRSKVDELLTHHPAAQKWDADRLKHRSHLEPGLYRFLRASVWPDDIKRKKGWPNHGSWHYADLPITGPDSPPLPDPHPEHHVLAALAENEAILRDQSASPEDRAIALSWVIHLVGDLHQPLHCATAVTAVHPEGDKGGNETFILIDGRRVKLHEFWDSLMGKSRKPEDGIKDATEFEHAARSDLHGGDATVWCEESRRLAQTVAYPKSFWSTPGVDVSVESGYVDAAKSVAQRRMLDGGRRLAQTIDHALTSL
jgi:hypothetical protein